MVTKVNDTVFDGVNPTVSDLNVTNFDATNGTVQTNATSGKQIVNFETMSSGLTSSVPAGVVLPFAGSSVPGPDWVFCDGTSYLTATYPALFAVIGYVYGGAGANFNVPDLRGRIPGGLDNMGGVSANRITTPNADSLGGAFGVEEITLSLAQTPSHNHNVSGSGSTGAGSPHTHTGSTNVAGNHTHTIYGLNWANNVGDSGTFSPFFGANQSGASGNHSHTMNLNNESAHTHSLSISISESNQGSNAPHDNVQPTLFMNYIIKVT